MCCQSTQRRNAGSYGESIAAAKKISIDGAALSELSDIYLLLKPETGASLRVGKMFFAVPQIQIYFSKNSVEHKGTVVS